MKTWITAVSLIACVISTSFAVPAQCEETYQTEVSAEYDHTADSQSNDSTLYGIAAQFFFEPVKTDDHPYAEAAFLERIGSFSVLAATFEQDISTLSTKVSGPAIAADVTLAKPGFPLTLEAMYLTENLDFESPNTGSVKITTYDVKIGNFFTNTFHAGIEYTANNTEFSGGLTGPTLKGTDYGLFAKYIYELEQSRELSFEGSVLLENLDDGTETLKNTDFTLSVDYFLNRSLSFGVNVGSNSGDDKSLTGTTYGANVLYFFTPRFSARVAYNRFENSSADEASNYTTTVLAALRF